MTITEEGLHLTIAAWALRQARDEVQKALDVNPERGALQDTINSIERDIASCEWIAVVANTGTPPS